MQMQTRRTVLTRGSGVTAGLGVFLAACGQQSGASGTSPAGQFKEPVTIQFSHRWEGVREPLVHFLIAGSILFWAGRAHERQTSIYRINETPERIAYLARQYALQFGSPPDQKMLQVLIHRDVEDEMLFREGLVLKLDQRELLDEGEREAAPPARRRPVVGPGRMWGRTTHAASQGSEST